MKINLSATVTFVYYPKRKASGDHMYSTILFYIQKQYDDHTAYLVFGTILTINSEYFLIQH